MDDLLIDICHQDYLIHRIGMHEVNAYLRDSEYIHEEETRTY